jgi:hypothetical protein
MTSLALMLVAVACISLALFLAIGIGTAKKDAAVVMAFASSLVMASSALVLAYLAGAA